MARLMLDSNALLWWIEEDGPLADDVRSMIDDAFNEVVVSAATIWELGIKQAKGRLRLPPGLLVQLEAVEIDLLEVTAAHGEAAAALPHHHGDPFDRMLIAQALQADYTIVTADRRFADYGVAVVSAR